MRTCAKVAAISAVGTALCVAAMYGAMTAFSQMGPAEDFRAGIRIVPWMAIPIFVAWFARVWTDIKREEEKP
jgi:hypothetical protein